jgi:hypothetical protein
MSRRAITKPSSDRFSRGAIVTHKDGRRGVVWAHYAERPSAPERVMVKNERTWMIDVWPVADCEVMP